MKYWKIEKVLVILFIVILFCTLFTACGKKSKNQAPNENLTSENEILDNISEIDDYVASYPIKVTSQTSEDEIAGKLFDLWLAHFKEEKIDDGIRLTNYEIDKIAIPPTFQNCVNDSSDVLFIAEIIFSVQTFRNPSPDWIAGTGTYHENGWINDKLAYVSVSKIDELYSLHILGIPPCFEDQ